MPIVYSCGIGEDLSFDTGVIAVKQARVFAFDPTPRVVEFVGSHAKALGSHFTFMPVAIGPEDGHLKLYPPADARWVSYSSVAKAGRSDGAIDVAMRSITSLMAQLGHDRVDVLKLDIEGSEYEVIDQLLKNGAQIGHLLVEFHHRFAGIGVPRTSAAIRALVRAGFLPYAVGESGHEVSFIHSSLL
jgi:FkbM family methyltransferase